MTNVVRQSLLDLATNDSKLSSLFDIVKVKVQPAQETVEYASVLF